MGKYAVKVKSSQYFKRYQTKFKRRRECKTDYYARKRMIIQDVNKLGCNKYRLVVRFTNQKCIAQIVYSTLEGDRILCRADSRELSRFGLTTGFVNYASSYATGLLIGRRLLKQLNLHEMYPGAEETSGQDYDVSALAETYSKDKKPFKAILDIGLTRSTVGNRVYAVMKGACDAGIAIPHNTRNFYGAECQKEDKKRKFTYNADAHRDRIFGCHVDEYMAKMKEEDEDKYKKHFRLWIECIKKNGVEDVEALYEKIFAAIRAKPEAVPTKKRTKKPQTYKDDLKTRIVTKHGEYTRSRKLSLAERKRRVQQKIAIFRENQEE